MITDDTVNRLLMSDSLKGVVPDFEDDVSKYEDAFVVASIVFGEEHKQILSASLVGFSFEGAVTKLDIRLSTLEAFKISKKIISDSLECSECFLTLASEDIRLGGPFQISSPKLLDFDRQNKLCTLGIDLIKI